MMQFFLIFLIDFLNLRIMYFEVNSPGILLKIKARQGSNKTTILMANLIYNSLSIQVM